MSLVSALRSSTRVVAVSPWMVKALGPGTAVWFAQMLWRMEVADSNRIVAADGSWEDDTGMNRNQVLRARQKVTELGWITVDVRKVAGAPTCHIELVPDALEGGYRAILCAESRNPGSRESAQTSSPQTREEGPSGDCAGGRLFEEPTRPGRRRPARTKIPKGWTPPAETVAAMIAEGIPQALLDAQTPRFVDYWLSEGRQKADWPATWRNWVRREHERTRDAVTHERTAPDANTTYR